MRIMRQTASPSATYYNCHIETGDRSKYSIGDRVLYDDGNVIVGPLKVVGEETHKIVVTADDDYAIYERTDLDEAEPNDLEPISLQEYFPVTSSIFLDGFLGAAYQDNAGIVRVDIDPSLPGLKDYYVQLMNTDGIEYRLTNDGFVFPDTSIIQDVFARQQDFMPPKYVIGFMSSFIVKTRVRINRNPRYERYMFPLPAAEEYYGGMAPGGLYYYSLRGQCALFSIFGSFEPLAHLIDSVESASNDQLFIEGNHFDDIFLKVAPKLLVKSFNLIGCDPRPLGAEGPIAYYRVNITENDQPRSAIISISTDGSEPTQKCDFSIRFNGRKPMLCNLYSKSEKKPAMQDLFYSPLFNYSKELRDYLQILFNKM